MNPVRVNPWGLVILAGILLTTGFLLGWVGCVLTTTK
jgi:hypothetical protein